jgi:hypothetical protein
MARALLPYLPSFLLLCAWAQSAVTGRDGMALAHTPPRWLPFDTRLRDLVEFGDVLRSGSDEMFVTWMLGLFLALAILGGVPLRKGAWRLPALALICLALYFAAPFDFGYMGWIAHRALPFAAILAVASPGLASRRATSGILGAAVALQLAYFVKLSVAYRAFDREAQVAELRELLQEATPGRALAAQIWDQESRVFRYRPYMHFGAYYEILRGGRSVYNFAETPWPPIRFRPGTQPAQMPIGWEWQPGAMDLEALARTENYLLIRGPGPPPPKSWRLVGRAGRWSLHEAVP